MPQETEKPNGDEQEEEQLTPRTFRDEIDTVIETHRDHDVADRELMDIMWSRIQRLDGTIEEETPYVWES